MKKIQRIPPFIVFLGLAACVTINVYFPAAAAESAADKLIKEVYGIENPSEEAETMPKDDMPESSQLQQNDSFFLVVLDFFIPAAQAQQANINISSPAINQLKSLMTARHQQLTPFYNIGAVGMDGNGLITIKDIKAVDLKNRNTVKKLVSDENRDRNALYAEIANANGHPEWEAEIRDTFARRWIANAPAGWWYNAGSWKQK